jgi:hypothetical protein
MLRNQHLGEQFFQAPDQSHEAVVTRSWDYLEIRLYRISDRMLRLPLRYCSLMQETHRSFDTPAGAD